MVYVLGHYDTCCDGAFRRIFSDRFHTRYSKFRCSAYRKTCCAEQFKKNDLDLHWSYDYYAMANGSKTDILVNEDIRLRGCMSFYIQKKVQFQMLGWRK